mgnify:CR=1 FL=1
MKRFIPVLLAAMVTTGGAYAQSINIGPGGVEVDPRSPRERAIDREIELAAPAFPIAQLSPVDRNTLRIAALGGSLLLIIGGCLFAFGAPTELATTMTIMGGFAALRICIFVLQVILFTQREKNRGEGVNILASQMHRLPPARNP